MNPAFESHNYVNPLPYNPNFNSLPYGKNLGWSELTDYLGFCAISTVFQLFNGWLVVLGFNFALTAKVISYHIGDA